MFSLNIILYFSAGFPPYTSVYQTNSFKPRLPMKKTEKNPGNTTRRTFIKSASLASAGFMIVPRHVLGKGFVAPSDKLNIAAVGCGGKADVNIRYSFNNGSDNIVALCDVDDRMSKKFRTQFPKAPYYRDYRQISCVRGFSTYTCLPSCMAVMAMG